MAFCKQCGADLNGARFCPNCGANADGSVMTAAGANFGMDVRQRSLADMENMMTYFGLKAAQYKELDEVTAEVGYRSENGPTKWLVAGIVCAVIGLLFKAVFFYVMAVLLVVVFVLRSKKNKELLTVAAERQAELKNELAQHYVDYGYCPIGLEYTEPGILNGIYEIIRKGRANNPGDAINLWLDDIHKAELEKSAAETAEASKLAAKSAKRAAGYSAASFWLKR